jgi:multisubunit Na+/H+ antiporter MnhF subunit
VNDSDEWFKRWVLGAILPLIPLFYGIRGVILRTSFIAGRNTQWEVVGPEAVAVSLCYLSLAVFLHAYFCWENRERLAGYRELLLIASLLSFLASAGYFVYLDFRP